MRIFLALLLFAASRVLACPSDLDPTFQGGGVFANPLGIEDPTFGTDIVVLPGGGIVVAAVVVSQHRWLPTIVRFKKDGSLDQSFGTGGAVTLDFAGEPRAISIDGLGRIIIGGVHDYETFPNHSFFVARLDASGNPDQTFGDGGFTVTEMGEQYFYIDDLAVLSDNRIVAVGVASEIGADADSEPIVACYAADGILDEDFGANGLASAAVGRGSGGATGVHAFDDDSFVVTGYLDKAGEMFVSKFDSEGAPIAAFSRDGVRTTHTRVGEAGGAIAVDGEGRIVVAGDVWNATTDRSKVFVRRFLANGRNDRSFGKRGKSRRVRFGYRVISDAVVVDTSGSVTISTSPRQRGKSSAVARFDAVGQRDAGFGRNGVLAPAFFSTGTIAALALQKDDKLILTGLSDAHMFVARLEGGPSDGSEFCAAEPQ